MTKILSIVLALVLLGATTGVPTILHYCNVGKGETGRQGDGADMATGRQSDEANEAKEDCCNDAACATADDESDDACCKDIVKVRSLAFDSETVPTTKLPRLSLNHVSFKLSSIPLFFYSSIPLFFYSSILQSQFSTFSSSRSLFLYSSNPLFLYSSILLFFIAKLSI